jgi:hypothetical protein
MAKALDSYGAARRSSTSVWANNLTGIVPGSRPHQYLQMRLHDQTQSSCLDYFDPPHALYPSLNANRWRITVPRLFSGREKGLERWPVSLLVRADSVFRSSAILTAYDYVVVRVVWHGTMPKETSMIWRSRVGLTISILLVVIIYLLTVIVRIENERYAMSLGMCAGIVAPDASCLSKVKSRTNPLWHLFYALQNR